MPGACNQDGAIYEATVKTNDSRVDSYVVLAKKIQKEISQTQVNFSKQERRWTNYTVKVCLGLNPRVTWKYLETNVPDFNPVTGTCKLCTREQFQILLNPAVATVNKKTKYFQAACIGFPTLLVTPQISELL